jgi:Glycosyltransferase sugar-binding region containing DXD motif
LLTRVNGVWTGRSLTNIEKLCIHSFQDHGHEFHLYVTESTEGVPPGTIVHSTDEIVPAGATSWFSNPGHFSDYFRYHLIYQIGGWYIDMDTVCLQRFIFEDVPYVFLAENEQTGGPSDKINLSYLTSCLFKAPAGCELLKNIIDEIESRDPRKGCNLPFPLSDINQGNGPPMFRKWVPRMGLERYIYPSRFFDVLSWHDYGKFVSSGWTWIPPEDVYAIHLRSSFWRCGNPGLVPNNKYPEDSLYEQLKKKHGVQ